MLLRVPAQAGDPKPFMSRLMAITLGEGVGEQRCFILISVLIHYLSFILEPKMLFTKEKKNKELLSFLFATYIMKSQ